MHQFAQEPLCVLCMTTQLSLWLLPLRRAPWQAVVKVGVWKCVGEASVWWVWGVSINSVNSAPCPVPACLSGT